MLNGKGAHGNARIIDGAVLHASVLVKIDKDGSYGGKKRDTLLAMALEADESTV